MGRKKKSLKEKEGESQQRFYPCDKCKRKLKSELSYKKHQEMHDNKEQIYKCTLCKEGKLLLTSLKVLFS